MAIKPINDFLDVYKKLETAIFNIDAKSLEKIKYVNTSAINADDINIFWLENNTNDINIQNKLRLCRMLRNYAQHNDDYKSFIAVTSDMILFINKLLKDLGCIDKTAGQICKKIQALTEKSLLTECCAMLVSKKLDWLPVIDSKTNTCLGVITYSNILSWISDGATLKSKLSNLITDKNKKIMTVIQDDVAYNNIPNSEYIIVIKDDIYKGIILKD